MNLRLTIAALLLTLVATSGCGPRIEAELPDVLLTRQEVQVPGLPAAVAGVESSVTVSFFQDAAETGLPRGSFSALSVRELVIEARSGVTNLSFVRRLRVTIADPARAGYPGATVELARYERDPDTTIGATLVVPRDPPIDALVPFRAETSVVTIELTGALPVEGWSVDVSVRASATLTY